MKSDSMYKYAIEILKEERKVIQDYINAIEDPDSYLVYRDDVTEDLERSTKRVKELDAAISKLEN